VGSKQPVQDPVIQFARLYLEAVRRLDLKMFWLMLSTSSHAFLKGYFYAGGQLAREKIGNCTHDDLQEPLEAMLIKYKAKIEAVFENTSIPMKPIYENSCQAIVPLIDIKVQVPVYFRPCQDLVGELPEMFFCSFPVTLSYPSRPTPKILGGDPQGRIIG